MSLRNQVATYEYEPTSDRLAKIVDADGSMTSSTTSAVSSGR